MSDDRVLRTALTKGLRIPARRFYVGAAQFAPRSGLLTPYFGERYQLEDWNEGNSKPRTSKELYNLRHSRFQMTAELTFARVQKKFKILRSTATEYNIKYQLMIIYAYTGLWNFFKSHENSQRRRPVDSEDAAVSWVANTWADLNVGASDQGCL